MNVSCPMKHGSRKPHARGLLRTARHGFVALFFFLVCLHCQAADRASWYGESHRGLPMANGQPFDPNRLTAASWVYPLGTKILVTHENQSVIVEITDRGPAKRLFRRGRKIDLSRAAFTMLADPDLGLIDVILRPL